MVGSALIRRLARKECRVLTVGRDVVALRDQTSSIAGSMRIGPGGAARRRAGSWQS
jgi:hypothetical protein